MRRDKSDCIANVSPVFSSLPSLVNLLWVFTLHAGFCSIKPIVSWSANVPGFQTKRPVAVLQRPHNEGRVRQGSARESMLPPKLRRVSSEVTDNLH